MAQNNQPKQYHNVPFYFGIAVFTTLIVGLPAIASVRTQQMMTKIQQTSVTQAALTMNTVNQAPAFAEHQAAVLKLLTTIETALNKAETALPSSQLSDETKASTQAAIDNAQTQVDSLQTQVADATTVEELVAIRQAAVQVLYENQDTIKALGVDIYVDSLGIMLDQDRLSVESANIVSAYLAKEFVKNKIDVTNLAALIVVANAAVQQADQSVGALTDVSTTEDLFAATVDTLMATESARAVTTELNTVVTKLPQAR